MSLVVITTNACFHSSEQVVAAASFLVSQYADVVFVQEANGRIDELLVELRKHVGFEHATLDPATHVIIRRGRFHSVKEDWPHNGYSRASITGSDFLLVNIHLCELQWDTGSDDDEQSFRGQYVQRTIEYIQSLVGDCILIVGGDFNSFSHQDKSLYNADNRVYERIYSRQVFSTEYISRTGLIDCWRACHPQSKEELETEEEQFVSWPVPLTAIEHDQRLLAEIDCKEVAGRIDFLFVNTHADVISCRMMHTSSGWYSDHLAVVAKLRIHATQSPSSSALPVSHSAVLDVVVTLGGSSRPTWLLTAGGLTGHKNCYIDIVRLSDNQETSLGWFYVDGLTNVHNGSIAACRSYSYGTFDPCATVDCTGSAQFQAVLYKEEGTECIRTTVRVIVCG